MDFMHELITRRVEKILPTREGLAALLGQKKIRLYMGFDPTGGRLHLGHTIGLRKLVEFANFGHEVIFLFGTGTVLVGDPSERDTGRKLITQEEIDENIKDWKNQVSPLVDFSKVTVKKNGDWLVPMTLKDIIKVASNISAVQLFKRESFTRRIDKGDTVWYHETMYPLLQGYDSVVMDVDLEIGGTDQEFNMLVGRELQRKMNNREKHVLTVPMILGTDGQQMSKTSGNCVWLNDSPEEMFGKLMRLPDEYITSYMELVTDIPMNRIGELKQALKDGNAHPMEAKKELARAVVSQLHDADKAEAAQSSFESVVQQKEIPEVMQSFSVLAGEYSLLNLLQQSGLGESNAQLKRVIEQGGVEYNGIKVTNSTQMVEPKDGDIIKFGKREFRKIKL